MDAEASYSNALNSLYANKRLQNRLEATLGQVEEMLIGNRDMKGNLKLLGSTENRAGMYGGQRSRPLSLCPHNPLVRLKQMKSGTELSHGSHHYEFRCDCLKDCVDPDHHFGCCLAHCHPHNMVILMTWHCRCGVAKRGSSQGEWDGSIQILAGRGISANG